MQQSGGQLPEAWSADISKIKEVLLQEGIFLNLHMYVYLRTKVQTSSIILTSFRWGNFNQRPNPTAKQTPKRPTQIRVKQLQLNDLFSQLNKLAKNFIKN